MPPVSHTIRTPRPPQFTNIHSTTSLTKNILLPRQLEVSSTSVTPNLTSISHRLRYQRKEAFPLLPRRSGLLNHPPNPLSRQVNLPLGTSQRSSIRRSLHTSIKDLWRFSVLPTSLTFLIFHILFEYLDNCILTPSSAFSLVALGLCQRSLRTCISRTNGPDSPHPTVPLQHLTSRIPIIPIY